MNSADQTSRIEELWADRALGELDPQAAAELRRNVFRLGIDDRITGAELALASVHVAVLSESPLEAMPQAVMNRIMAAIPAEPARAPAPMRILPWVSMAAAITLAVFSWIPRAGNAARFDAAEIDARPDAVHLAWGDWDKPEIPGVRGEVVWSESTQSGYMKFTGLPANDPSRERYQLWIIDERGMEQRISGALFDAAGQGDVVVPITPGIPVRNAGAFAVTIERPQGVWVSDMTRRVSIAAVAAK